jgi:xanthine dehydrogenase YagR molybdenum-binding subunit
MPIRIVTTHLEFEGQLQEVRVLLEGEEPPVWGPEAELRVVGQGTPRVDARERVTGAAKYAFDIQLPGMLYAAALRSPHPHARVTRVDVSQAQGMPGVRAILTCENAGDYLDPNRKTPILDREVLYAGQMIALAVAETRAQATDALARIAVEYEPLPFVTEMGAALAEGAPMVSTTFETNSISEEWPNT